jgi:hypothetical protein
MQLIGKLRATACAAGVLECRVPVIARRYQKMRRNSRGIGPCTQMLGGLASGYIVVESDIKTGQA